jgi:hypothetical protein
MDHVEAVLTDSVRICCSTGPLLSELLALGAAASHEGANIPFGSKHALAAVLSQLQRLQVPFADAPSGWPPAAIFAQLRDEGLVHGSITAVTWSSPDQPVLRAA